MSQRVRYILKGIDVKENVGLELGPLTMPTVKKDNGVKISYLDHMSTTDLIEKYKNEPIDPTDIVDVDFVANGTVKESVNGKKFDYVIASHVIEHIPNTVAWLKEIGEVLKPGGVLALAIPDKRYTFDIFRDTTSPSSIIGAYIDNVDRSTGAMVYDSCVNYMKDIDASSVWRDPEYYTKIRPKHRWTSTDAFEFVKRNATGEYVDVHCHVFTPVSFLNIIKSLMELGLIDFSIEHFTSTPENELEFYVTLKKTKLHEGTTKNKEISKISRLLKKYAPSALNARKMEELERQNLALIHQLNSVTNSLSWKVTEPLRTVRKYIR